MTRLPNGLRVVTDRMDHVESASIGVWIGTGARYETLAENGMSHMLEHMLFKGTKRRSPRAIAEEIESVGGHMNAYTARDHTTFYAKVLKEDVPLAADLLADILQNSLIDENELRREREVIIQEIGQAEDTPDDIVFDYLQEAAYPDQPLGRSILGTEQRVAGFMRDDVISYLKSCYRAQNMVIAAAGNIQHDEIVRLVEDLFIDIPQGQGRAFEPATYLAGERHERRITEQLHLTLGFPGQAFGNPDYYAAQVFSTIFGGGMSSRLFQEVREVRGLAYSIYSFGVSQCDTGLFGIYAGTSPEFAHDLVDVIASEMHQLMKAVPEEEISRARAQLKAGLLMSMESTSSRIEQMGRQMLIFDRIIDTDELVERVEAVDSSALVRVCEHMMGTGRPTVATVGPVGTLPDYDKITGLFALA